MLDKFAVFARVVAVQFQHLTRDQNVFAVDVSGDRLYQAYLAAFPEGTNPIYKTNPEHDCSCCKHFIRRAGMVVRIKNTRNHWHTHEDDHLETVWDRAAEIEEVPERYRKVAAALRNLVRTAAIRDRYVVGQNEQSFGAQVSRSVDKETQRAMRWDHFYTGDIARHLRLPLPDTARGEYRTTVQVFERGLLELTTDAVDTVLSLIQQNALYRGEEHKNAVVGFRKMQVEYLAMTPRERVLFAWANANNPAARFRNTVIGTLVQDLSEGQDLEHAVKSFETKVAPQNYKRTTALITPGMVKKAMETINELGLEPALERRFATLADISVNDVLWVDGAAKPLMKGGLADALMQHASANKPATKDEERAEDIPIDEFVHQILPQVTGLEILFKNELAGNLVSLTAPVYPEPKQLFRWTNDFAWSYGGNVADSIKERVKKAGGKIEGALRVSLSWSNYDDLDLHILEPTGRGSAGAYGRIFFGNKRGWTGGQLDVDMNAGSGHTREPVENVIWVARPPDGIYKVVVNQFSLRESTDPGFVVEIESAGKVSHFSYNKQVRQGENIEVAELTLKDGALVSVKAINPGITAASVSKDKWGLKTEQWAKVAAVTFSPNYWGDNAVGNKHTFFLLDGCKNDEEARGFFNEFLHPRLESHRKVFEVIADKTKCYPTDAQLSGLGFSSTKKESFLVRARTGARARIFNVQVGVASARTSVSPSTLSGELA